jgi:hypothetical protein
MRIGVGTGIGPVRVGASTSAGGCFTFIGYFFVICVLALLVGWPYLLGTWLAVQLGAGLDSSARAVTGCVFEGVVVIGGLFLFAGRASRAKARAEQQKRQERWQRASDDHRLLGEELQQLDTTLGDLVAQPRGVASSLVKPKERLLASYAGAELLEPRSVSRGGPRVHTGVDEGTAVVSDTAVRFLGNSKSVEWRFDRMIDRRVEPDGLVFSVSNRQLVSGVRVPSTFGASLLAAVTWAQTLAGGADPAVARSKVEAIRRALQKSLEQAGRELADRRAELSGPEGVSPGPSR